MPARHIYAATVNVSSIAALQTAVNSAATGDTVVLANGTYLNNTLTIGTSNITVRSSTPGGVFLNGTNAITITGNNVTFLGFQFTSGAISGIAITVEGNYVKLTQLNFNGYSAQKYVNFKGQYDELSYSNIENKPAAAPIGNLIHISTRADGTPTHTRIHHNSFKNMPGAGGDNGNECIRITNAAPSTYFAGCIIEFNYFENTGYGDSEVISVKSEGNVIRYNTMENNNRGNFCFRYGNNNVAYGNFFRNSGGIRIKQSNNIYCYNNYFENCGDGSITAPIKFVYVTGCNTNCVIVHNTIVGGSPVEVDAGGSANTMANNIFKNTTGNIFSGTVSGISFAGNIYSGPLGVPIPSGMTNADPLLISNSDGYLGISSASPAINASSTNYPAILDIAGADDDPNILLDISGQSRPTTVSQKDVGCDEYSTGTTVIRPLTLSDVGPSYLGGPVNQGKLSQTITFPSLPTKVVGDADFNPGATASSGLAVACASSNTAVATVVNGLIHIINAGTAVITATQPGNAVYAPAADVSRTLTVISLTAYYYTPTATVISSGSLRSGNYSNLATNNSSYYVLNSTTSGARKSDWYGSAVISQSASSVVRLTVRYDGKYSVNTTQTLYLYNWSAGIWSPIDSRSVGTSDVLIASIQSSPASFISNTGEIRLRVSSTGGTKNYTCSGDWMQFVVESSTPMPRVSESIAATSLIEPEGMADDGLLLYPNPACSHATLESRFPKGTIVDCAIYTAKGERVREHSFDQPENGSQTFEITDLADGIYFLRVTTNQRTVTLRLAVKK